MILIFNFDWHGNLEEQQNGVTYAYNLTISILIYWRINIFNSYIKLTYMAICYVIYYILKVTTYINEKTENFSFLMQKMYFYLE